ncbi:signal peptidase I [Xanthomonas arboricola pv. corylina]|uniref:signal peptidase I n=1 Tax=Xanthomonas arboricola TaxID=56448 RepID=UPI002018F338|nr:signal peptidase I [Xanthomonas arboricola]UQQ13379.1 signal peptidase I [Xanthomonas arboricola pv. corylina]
MKWFEIALVVLTLGTGFIWLLDKLFLAKRRAARAGLLDSEPAIIDYSRAFFPVLAVVLILRSFVAEPYKIPSSSMMPNLLIGDFILVNKFAYGFRLPITNTKFIPTGEPKRGDVVVFKPPHAPDQNWIKRVVGLPGDKIGFHGDTLYINDKPMRYTVKGEYIGKGKGAEMTGTTLLVEDLPGRTHTVLEWVDRNMPAGQGDWTVPADSYFVMGDNRDNSEDGRFWTQTHFLPEANLRGKAFLIWLNCEGWFCKGSFDPSRIGTGIQ